ncbi:hypothetical protein HA466_0038030 [Hirschfeldia incana]|nr:hypothetical protein HA466_0038030 [Hirschfeldia incana]
MGMRLLRFRMGLRLWRGVLKVLLMLWRIGRRIYGLQYHHEVTHSPKGMETLKHFLFDVCGVSADLKMDDLMEEEIKVINKTVAADEHVICAFSGGVDSTVAATLVHKAIGDMLHCIFVDNGLLRYKEQERVMDPLLRETCIYLLLV